MPTRPPHTCPGMTDAIGDELQLVRYNAKFREYGLVIHDGGTSSLLIGYCPFCGVTLPESLRERWFEVLEGLGHEPGDEGVPATMLTDEWWADFE